MKLEVFHPVMKHALNDNKQPVVFHFQLVRDFLTVEEIAKKVLLELQRGSRSRYGRSMSSFSHETATMQTTAARLGIEERQLELTKFLMAEDPLPVVLRAHIHIEEELVAFITGQGHPKKAVPSKYAHRVELALKLGLPDEFKKQLAVLGPLRNRFAHRANAAIETSDAEKFDAAHEPGDTVVEYAYNSTLAKLNESVRKPSVHDLDQKSALSCTLSRSGPLVLTLTPNFLPQAAGS